MKTAIQVLILLIAAVCSRAWTTVGQTSRKMTTIRSPISIPRLWVSRLTMSKAVDQPSSSSSSSLTRRKIEILARDMELSESLKARVDSKIGKVVNKLGHNVQSTHVTLRVHLFPNAEMHSHVTKKNSQIAEVTLYMKGGSVIHASERSEDMYTSIDLLSHTLAKNIKRHNEKVSQKRKENGISTMFNFEGSEDYASVEGFDEEELLREIDANVYKNYNEIRSKNALNPAIVKSKVFDMPPISLEDATANLSFMDHDFYVFRNKESNEINVIYKRDGGGYGHIVPGESY